MKTRISLCLASPILAALLLGASPFLHADVTMPAIFGDHMVLQQGGTLPVWGMAAAGEEVTVTAGAATAKTTAGVDGKWRVDLAALQGSTEPITLTVSGKNKLTFSDVLVGDVWACSGQSNMATGITTSSRGKEDIAKANRPLLRLFIVTQTTAYTPLDDMPLEKNPKLSLVGHWQVCTPEMLVGHGGWPDSFSAVAYYFGSEIQERTKLPVGLIQCAYGGLRIQSFISLDALKANPDFAKYAAQHEKAKAAAPAAEAAFPALKVEFDAKMKAWNEQHGAAFKQIMADWTKASAAATAARAPVSPRPTPSVPMPVAPPDGKPQATTPTHIFNSMINPIIPFGIKGVIWYQGETNRFDPSPSDYDKLFATLITDWRTRWGRGDFPFLFVQLANFMAPTTQPVEESGLAMIRDLQQRTLKVPNTAMAVAVDIGEANDIHPRNKADVGHRLALAARKLVYGEDIEHSGPLYDAMSVEADKIRIRFQHAKGLKIAANPKLFPDDTSTAPAELQAFAICGADKKWVAAKAVIDGETVVVSSNEVKAPVAVRYGWANNPPCFLYNAADLPAAPFRTDH